MQKGKLIKNDQNETQIISYNKRDNNLFYYKKNGKKSYDSIKVNQILEKVNLGVSEEILGMFEISGRIIKPPIIVITTQKIVEVRLPIILFFGEGLRALKKTQIAGYRIRKGLIKDELFLNLVNGSSVLIRGINRNVFHSIIQALDNFQKEDIETIAREFKPSITKPITEISEPFFCQVCEASRPATTSRMKCESCNRFICFDCFSQMANVGKTNCPMCGGKLYSQ